MTEAMTAIERAIMMVWLRPSSSSLRASGSRAVSSRCRPVAPSEAAASMTPASAPRSPRAVSRAIGGAA